MLRGGCRAPESTQGTGIDSCFFTSSLPIAAAKACIHPRPKDSKSLA